MIRSLSKRVALLIPQIKRLYEEHKALSQERLALRSELDSLKRELEASRSLCGAEQFLFENFGYCPLCEAPSKFTARHPWLRDSYRCCRCNSIPRERALITVLSSRYPNWRDLRIHESSPGTRSSLKYARECHQYIGTHFSRHVPPGSIHRGYRNENLEAQTFADDSFDIVMTQDVLEHVFDPGAAFREIARTLKPGGAHIFTVPIYKDLRVTKRQAKCVDGRLEHLAAPAYHSNPIDPDGSLVTFRYGQDLPELIMLECNLPTTVYNVTDRSLGILGEFLEVLVTHKPERLSGWGAE